VNDNSPRGVNESSPEESQIEESHAEESHNGDLDYPPTNRKKRDSRLESLPPAVCKQYPRLQEAVADYMAAPGEERITPSARLVVDIMNAAGGASEDEVIACLRCLREERGLRPGAKNGPRHFNWFKTVVADYFAQKRDRDLVTGNGPRGGCGRRTSDGSIPVIDGGPGMINWELQREVLAGPTHILLQHGLRIIGE
jgi:hypothetical protein